MTTRPKVFVTDFITDKLETERQILGDIADLAALGAHHEDELRGRIEDAEAIMIYHMLKITQRTIERLDHCKLIVRCGVGYDNVDGPAARRRDITLCNVPDYGTEEVADSAIGLTLALTRGITFLNSRLRDKLGPWIYTQVQPVWRLRGRTFGIVGLGRIGTAAALRAKALGMDVLFFDPYAADGRDKALGVRRVETLDELLAVSHVLSLHCPLTPETRHMVKRRNARATAARQFPGEHGAGGRGRHDGHSSGDRLGPPGGRRHRRIRRRAAGRRSSADRGLAQSAASGAPSRAHQSALGVLQRRGPE